MISSTHFHLALKLEALSFFQIRKPLSSFRTEQDGTRFEICSNGFCNEQQKDVWTRLIKIGFILGKTFCETFFTKYDNGFTIFLRACMDRSLVRVQSLLKISVMRDTSIPFASSSMFELQCKSNNMVVGRKSEIFSHCYNTLKISVMWDPHEWTHSQVQACSS
jgi:hypothetical protein